MKLINNNEAFEFVFDGKDYTAPSGEFEVTNNHLGYFIQELGIKWKKDVSIVDGDMSDPIKQEIKITPKTEPVKSSISDAAKTATPKTDVIKEEPAKGQAPKKTIKK